ncbi:15766_t:CDS:1 [Racocetra persica]|uniref:15766_t:CDS:1 n=1 Tax=Racocetra persica TaxID=160502 RepID=A0ACA9LID5_9GLOM|nr:15766_t:CDS:1 [Racocetra persica]
MQENVKKRSIGTKGNITSSNIDSADVENVVGHEYSSDDQEDTQIKRIKFDIKSVERSNDDETSGDPPPSIDDKQSKDNNTLPDDFFDNSSKTVSSQQEKATNEIEEEWILFQKLISKETQVSNQIAYEDEEELQRDRDEMLEREQKMCIKRSERLKEVAKKVRKNREQKMVDIVKKDIDESDDDSDEDIDDGFENEWMDWRAQRIL